MALPDRDGTLVPLVVRLALALIIGGAGRWSLDACLASGLLSR